MSRRLNVSEYDNVKAKTSHLDFPIVAILPNPQHEWKKLVYGSKRCAGSIDVDWKKFNPTDYLFSHCSIVSSVQVEPNGYYIKPICNPIVNANGNSWSNEVLLATFKSFIGGYNFLEHVQAPSLSKGTILDAVLRPFTYKDDFGNTSDIFICDILVATSRKHWDLVQKIQTGIMSQLSMGTVCRWVTCSKCGGVFADDDDSCEHIKHELLTTFIDEHGIRRIVSEMCFPPDTRIVMSDGTRKAISSIKNGETVLSHIGNKKEVLEIMKRKYSGEMVSLRTMGLPKNIISTPNHPFLVISSEKECSCGCGMPLKTSLKTGRQKYIVKYAQGHNPAKVKTDRNIYPEWKEAKDLENGDLLLLPIPKEEKETDDINENRAFILGWFLAEGSYRKKTKNNPEKVGISFALGKDEKEIGNKLADLLRKEFLPNSYKNRTAEPHVSARGWKVIVDFQSKEAAKWLFKHVGEYASKKKFSEEAMFWPIKFQKLILSAYVNGDGCCDTFGRHTSTTVSVDLADQLQILSARCGIWSRRQIIFQDKARDIGEIEIGKRDERNWLQRQEIHYSPSKETNKIFGMCTKVGSRNMWRREGDYFLYKIISKEIINYDGDVYNLSINEDNSYLVEGLSVHNCGRMIKNPVTGLWEGDPESNKFIEASWVENPAFKGAVLNHFVEPQGFVNEKYASIMEDKQLGEMFTDILGLRVADKHGMLAIRLAQQEYQKQLRLHTIEKILKG